MSARMEAVKQQSITNFLESPFDSTKMKPLMTSTPINSSIPRKRKATDFTDKDQMVLDFGQKDIGMKNCEECGMVYNVDDIKDREAHDNFHNRFEKTKFFKVEKRSLTSWKNKHYNEVNVGKVSGTIFEVEKKKASSLKTKFENIVKEIVDVQLHICEDVPVFDPNKVTKGYVYVVDADKTELPYIGAVVMTERVFAATLMPVGKVYRDLNKDHGFVAIERLWVHPLIRRKGVASHLLDVVRRLYSNSQTLQRSRIAFIDPNPICIEFGKTFLDKGGKWMKSDGDDGDSIQTGISSQMGIEKKDDEIPKKIMKVKKENNVEHERIALKQTKKIVKVEKEDVKPSKAIIKTGDKENQNQVKQEKDMSPSKVKNEQPSLKNLCRTIIIDENMDSTTPIEVPLLPPTV